MTKKPQQSGSRQPEQVPGVDADILAAWLGSDDADSEEKPAEETPPAAGAAPGVGSFPTPAPPGQHATPQPPAPASIYSNEPAPAPPESPPPAAGSFFDTPAPPAATPPPAPAEAPAAPDLSEFELGFLGDEAPVPEAPATDTAITGPVPAPSPPAPAPPAPAAPAEALCLEIFCGGARAQVTVEGECLIGRPDPARRLKPDIDLRADDAVSRRHARVFRREQRFYLEDLGSTNGTRHNDEFVTPHEPVPLSPGDRIDLGEGSQIRILEGSTADG